MRKWLSALAVFLFVSGVIAYTSIFRISKNFYEIDPGKYYRSAQLTKFELEDAIKRYGIKTVISVRGYPQPILNDEPEAETLERLGVGFQKYDLTTDYFPSKADIVSIIKALKNAPRPILVHCRTGADRTGMISAIYQIEEMKRPKQEALDQLSFKYWHVQQFHPAMSAFVEAYQGYDWADQKYDPCEFPQFLENTKDCHGAKNYPPL